MPIQPPEKTIADWKAAYREAHNRTQAPLMKYNKGWFWIAGQYGPSMREAQVLAMTDTLRKHTTATSNAKSSPGKG